MQLSQQVQLFPSTDLNWEHLLSGRGTPPQPTAPRGEGSGWRFSPPGVGEAGSVLLCWRAVLGESQLLLPSSSCSEERRGMQTSQFLLLIRKPHKQGQGGPQVPSVCITKRWSRAIQHSHCCELCSMHHNSRAISNTSNLKTQHWLY